MKNFSKAHVIWLTGLSGAGKSTIAGQLRQALAERGQPTCVLDGDSVRCGLCSDLKFSPAERRENVRRIGEVAKLFVETGVHCIVAVISPYEADRQVARAIVPRGQFIEVYVNAPLEICERRDPKGLYAKARAGILKEFTGVSAPYEPPVQPQIELPTDQLTIGESVRRILDYLQAAAKPGADSWPATQVAKHAIETSAAGAGGSGKTVKAFPCMQ